MSACGHAGIIGECFSRSKSFKGWVQWGQGGFAIFEPIGPLFRKLGPGTLAAAACAAAFACFPEVRENTLSLARMNVSAASLRELGVPGSGETVLPETVRELMALLRENGVRSYRCSERVCGEELIGQRLSEGAFPIERARSAPFLLLRAEEPKPAGCAEKGGAHGILLLHCP